MPLEQVLTRSGQIFPASEEKSFVLLGWISSNGTRSVKPRSNSASAHVKPGGIEAPVTIPSFLNLAFARTPEFLESSRKGGFINYL